MPRNIVKSSHEWLRRLNFILNNPDLKWTSNKQTIMSFKSLTSLSTKPSKASKFLCCFQLLEYNSSTRSVTIAFTSVSSPPSLSLEPLWAYHQRKLNNTPVHWYCFYSSTRSTQSIVSSAFNWDESSTFEKLTWIWVTWNAFSMEVSNEMYTHSILAFRLWNVLRAVTH